MNQLLSRQKAGWTGLTLAILLGVLHTFLLYQKDRGINGIIFTNLLAITLLGIAHWRRCLTPRVGLLTILLVGLAVAIGGRYSEFLGFWNRIGYALAWFLLLGQVMQPQKWLDLDRFGWQRLGNRIQTEQKSLGGSLREWRRQMQAGQWRALPWKSLGRGVLLSVPILAVFTALFVAADADYARALRELIGVPNFDLSRIFEHVGRLVSTLWWAGLVWLLIVAAWVRENTFSLKKPRTSWQGSAQGRVAKIELGVLLGSINLLFLSFIAFQVRYLFGGERTLRDLDLTYSEYAVSGYTEMLWIAGASLGVILSVLAYVYWVRGTYGRFVQSLTGFWIGQVLVVLASAAKRWGLYAQEYGLSEVRLYSLAFGVFVLAIYLGLAWLLGRNYHWKWLQLTAFSAFFLILALLNILNPDATIARYNQTIERPLDREYLYTLSADATPVLTNLEIESAEKRRYCTELQARLDFLNRYSRLEQKIPHETYEYLLREKLRECSPTNSR